MGRNGIFMSEPHQSHKGAATSQKQRPSDTDAAWKTHGPMTIIKKMLEAKTNVTKSRALKNIVPLIAHMHAWKEGPNAGNPLDCRIHQPDSTKIQILINEVQNPQQSHSIYCSEYFTLQRPHEIKLSNELTRLQICQ